MGKGIRPAYIISKKTKAIITKHSNYHRALILEENNIEKLSIHKPEQIISNSCIVHGVTFAGRMPAVERILNTTIKLPIPISVAVGIYLIPTASLKNEDCVLIAYHQIDQYEERNGKTFISFYDGTGIYVNTSINSFDSQYKRTSQVIVHLNRGVLLGQALR